MQKKSHLGFLLIFQIIGFSLLVTSFSPLDIVALLIALLLLFISVIPYIINGFELFRFLRDEALAFLIISFISLVILFLIIINGAEEFFPCLIAMAVFLLIGYFSFRLAIFFDKKNDLISLKKGAATKPPLSSKPLISQSRTIPSAQSPGSGSTAAKAAVSTPATKTSEPLKQKSPSEIREELKQKENTLKHLAEEVNEKEASPAKSESSHEPVSAVRPEAHLDPQFYCTEGQNLLMESVRMILPQEDILRQPGFPGNRLLYATDPEETFTAACEYADALSRILAQTDSGMLNDLLSDLSPAEARSGLEAFGFYAQFSQKANAFDSLLTRLMNISGGDVR